MAPSIKRKSNIKFLLCIYKKFYKWNNFFLIIERCEKSRTHKTFSELIFSNVLHHFLFETDEENSVRTKRFNKLWYIFFQTNATKVQLLRNNRTNFEYKQTRAISTISKTTSFQKNYSQDLRIPKKSFAPLFTK